MPQQNLEEDFVGEIVETNLAREDGKYSFFSIVVRDERKIFSEDETMLFKYAKEQGYSHAELSVLNNTYQKGDRVSVKIYCDGSINAPRLVGRKGLEEKAGEEKADKEKDWDTT